MHGYQWSEAHAVLNFCDPIGRDRGQCDGHDGRIRRSTQLPIDLTPKAKGVSSAIWVDGYAI